MEEKNSLRGRGYIPCEKKRECLDLFSQGYGYKKAAQLAGLNTYTVRDYKRRYAQGDDFLGIPGMGECYPVRRYQCEGSGQSGARYSLRLDMRALLL